jgi:hypothetical protein
LNDVRNRRSSQNQLPPDIIPAEFRGTYLLNDAVKTAHKFFDDFPDLIGTNMTVTTGTSAAAAGVNSDPELAAIWNGVRGVYREVFAGIIDMPPLPGVGGSGSM